MNVLFFGDSHAMCYIKLGANKIQNDVKFDVCSVGGASAQGVVNPNSKTNALSVYRERIKKYKNNNDNDYFAIMLGEVDCGFVIWYRAKKYNQTIIHPKLNQSSKVDERPYAKCKKTLRQPNRYREMDATYSSVDRIYFQQGASILARNPKTILRNREYYPFLRGLLENRAKIDAPC